MRLEIKHRTVYTYGTQANYAAQALRLSPPEFDGQTVVSWAIAAPGIETAARYSDGFGNLVHIATFQGAHDSVTIEASGVIETVDRLGVAFGIPEPAPLRTYLRSTPMTFASTGIRGLAQKCGQKSPLERLHNLMYAVHEAISYEPGSTTAATTAAEALAAGRGVCQDHAHVFISAARVLQIPARYVNGYFLSGTTDPEEAHHAWAEVFVEGLGWLGFDPANLICPTERYVRLATGLDSTSAAPIQGIRRGGENETLDVTVEVHQQGAQQQ